MTESYSYKIHKIQKSESNVEFLKFFFAEGEANYMNFVLFSTSGIHGSYLTIEDIEKLIKDEPEKIHELTILLIQPRKVCIFYGQIEVTSEDIEYLKKLRQSSWDAILYIGKSKEK